MKQGIEMADDTGKQDGKDAKDTKDRGQGKQFRAGVAVGIGSAAIVAALLYARSGKPKKK